MCTIALSILFPSSPLLSIGYELKKMCDILDQIRPTHHRAILPFQSNISRRRQHKVIKLLLYGLVQPLMLPRLIFEHFRIITQQLRLNGRNMVCVDSGSEDCVSRRATHSIFGRRRSWAQPWRQRSMYRLVTIP